MSTNKEHVHHTVEVKLLLRCEVDTDEDTIRGKTGCQRESMEQTKWTIDSQYDSNVLK